MDSEHLQGFHTMQGGAEAQPPLQSSLMAFTFLDFLPSPRLDCRELSHSERSQASQSSLQ